MTGVEAEKRKKKRHTAILPYVMCKKGWKKQHFAHTKRTKNSEKNKNWRIQWKKKNLQEQNHIGYRSQPFFCRIFFLFVRSETKRAYKVVKLTLTLLISLILSRNLNCTFFVVEIKEGSLLYSQCSMFMGRIITNFFSLSIRSSVAVAVCVCLSMCAFRLSWVHD